MIRAAQGLRRHLTMERAVLLAIVLFSFAFRVAQLDTSFFGPEQAWIAQAGWEIASLRDFHTVMYKSGAGYHNFPLTYYLAAIPFFFSDDIYALLLFFIAMNLVPIWLCWHFTRRYWGWRAAALATVVYANMPWVILLSYRIWNNTFIPPFVMLWAVGCGLAFGEKRSRWLMLAWGAAWLSIQLHISGILLLITLFPMMWIVRLPRAWRYAFVGSLLALLPALPWLYALITGVAHWGLDFKWSTGDAGLRINFQRIIEFLTAHDLAANFISEGRDHLAARLAYMRYLAPIWLLLYGGSLLFLVERIWRAEAKRRPLYLLLTLWCLLPLGFNFVARQPYTIVYYLPMLPAPCIALALMWKRMTEKHPLLHLPIAMALLLLCVLNLNAVWSIEQYISDEMRDMDITSHAFSLDIWVYPPPLVWQLEVAREMRALLDAGDAAELIMIQYTLPHESYYHLRWPFPYHLQGYGVRAVNIYGPHLVYPERTALYLRNEMEVDHNGGYGEGLEFRGQIGPYVLYHLPGGAWPVPQYPLAERPEYANGLRLLGYDELGCDGSWQLHWTPPAIPGKEDEHVHFFIHLLNATGERLTQRDLRAYDARAWRPGDHTDTSADEVWDWRAGDHVVTSIDFGQALNDLPIETIRIGLYYYSDDTESFQGDIYALDELGRPWEYAVDIPYEEKCSL